MVYSRIQSRRGGRSRRRGRSLRKRVAKGGLFTEALVPFGLLGLQKMMRNRKQSKRRKSRRGRRTNRRR